MRNTTEYEGAKVVIAFHSFKTSQKLMCCVETSIRQLRSHLRIKKQVNDRNQLENLEKQQDNFCRRNLLKCIPENKVQGAYAYERKGQKVLKTRAKSNHKHNLMNFLARLSH